MLVTEYAHQAGQWQTIRQYYRFAPDLPQDDNLRPPRDPCPGCGRPLSAPVLRTHECLGGREGYPRIPQVKVRIRLQRDQALINEYIRARGHRTVSTE